jgi:hypothetical protein
MKTKVVLLSIIAAVPLAAQWLNQPTVGIPRTPDGKPNLSAPAPRTADGKPDLSGLWTKISPKYNRNIAADLKPGDVQPWAEALVKQRKEDLSKDYMNVICVPLGPGYTTAGDTTGSEQIKIVQTPTLIMILNPDLTYRQVFMDGRKLEADPNPSWMGYSVGRWEGDTLVVESNGFNDRTWLDHDGHPHTQALRMVERYRRPNFGNLDLEVTFTDPGAYNKTWTVAVRSILAADTEMVEFVCNEQNHRTEHWIGKASDERKTEVKVAPEILAKYTGTYIEQPPFWRTVPRVVDITFEDGVLYGDWDGRGRTPLIAQSETAFSGFFGLGIEFFKDAQGKPTHLFVKHVSGDYRFTPKK